MLKIVIGAWLSLNILVNNGPKVEPKIPVKITAAIVISGMPPILIAISFAIAVVTDLGINEMINVLSSFNQVPNMYTLDIETAVPIIDEISIKAQYFFRISQSFNS